MLYHLRSSIPGRPRLHAHDKPFDSLAVWAAALLVLASLSSPSLAQVCNVKVVTDASPDYHDLPSLIHSATSRWETPAEKCWALFYWTHLARRQTTPMRLHGMELTDPIRQFNDYGYAMCSTVAGINCSLWDALRLDVRFWDITLHTVSEVFYDEGWHVYDNSMSALYTLCDGVTIAGVEDVGKEGACQASGGRREPGHIARYHCLTATSPNGFLTGADCARDLEQEYRCFRPSGLKHRYYYHNWDRGHRYIVNLRRGESYIRHYRSLGSGPEYYVPSGGKDPEAANPRYRIRGSGVRRFVPELTAELLERVTHSAEGVVALEPSGVRPASAGRRGILVFKVEGSNVVTSLAIDARLRRRESGDRASISVSTTNGRSWKEVWRAEGTGVVDADLDLVDEVNGAYEILVKVRLEAVDDPAAVALERIALEARTMLNSKTLPRLLIGRNTVHVETGDPTESIVLWPDLRGGRYRTLIQDEENVATLEEHRGYQGVLFAQKAGRPARVTFRIDAPRDIRRVVHGGRLYNRAPGSRIIFRHSFDGGASWSESYRLEKTDPPWDVIHHETIDMVPTGTRVVLLQYVLEGQAAGPSACSLYAVRMEAQHEPADPGFRPLALTFRYREILEDDQTVERVHREIVKRVPHRYSIDVGGADHPVMESLTIATASPEDAASASRDGESEAGRAPPAKYRPRWVTYGRNLAIGCPYTVSVPSRENWGAGDPDLRKLTDGVVGPPYAGGIGPRYAACWQEGDDPVVTVDLGVPEACGAFRIHLSGGWPWWDALKGEVKDRVAVETSIDGDRYEPQGEFCMRLRWKDIPVNHLMPDDETATGPIFELALLHPVRARYVRFRIRPARILTVSEVEVLDEIRYEPFDLLVALPAVEERGPLLLEVSPDGPLKSLAAARDAIRELRRSNPAGLGPVTVRVRGGRYRLDAPFVLEPEDSGTAEAPVVYEAAPGERPVFSGGRVLTGWREKGDLWERDLPEVREGQWTFRQLFVDGERRPRARAPNRGYFRLVNPSPKILDAEGKELEPGRWGFEFDPDDLRPYRTLEEAVVVLMHSWETSIHPIASVDLDTRILRFRAPLSEWWTIGYWERRQRYYLENTPEALDSPGEWYLDRKTGVLRYQPREGEQPDEVEVVAPRLTELVRVAGDADRGRPVRHVTLRGLAFHHADWTLSPRGNSSTQAAVKVPAAVMVDGARCFALEECEVAHVGTYGVWLRRGCHDCRVVQNRLRDLGAGGIRVGETSAASTDEAESTRNVIDNNHIFDGGRVYPAGVGIWVAQSSHNRLSHNEIHDINYSGISVGWNWNDAPNRCHHNTIEYNRVHHIVNGVLSDAGAIYTLGVSTGSVIRHNVFHDVWPYDTPPFGWGIYLDASTSGYRVEGNLVYNTLSGGLMFNNGGHENVFENNLFALSAHIALWPYWHAKPNTFRRNIVYLTQGELFRPHAEGTLRERLASGGSLGEWDENLYWHANGPGRLRFFRMTFDEWQALGIDERSRVADPLFVDIDDHDFALEPDSPALELGFRPIDASRAGLRGDAAWVEEARAMRRSTRRLPPPPSPPSPVEVDDGFETTAAGAHPAGARVSGEERGAAIRVTEEKAATGARCLKVTDSSQLQPAWQPHFYYEPHFRDGSARQSFDVFLEPSTVMFAEWRDATAYPACVGPSVTFGPEGQVSAAGKKLTTVPTGRWVGVSIEAKLGEESPRTWRLEVRVPGQAPLEFTGLPVSGRDFHELHWAGFSSTAAADTAFYLDNLQIER